VEDVPRVGQVNRRRNNKDIGKECRRFVLLLAKSLVDAVLDAQDEAEPR